MNNYKSASDIFNHLTTSLNVDLTPEKELCHKIKSHILESKSDSLVSDMAFAINFVSGSGTILNENISPLFEKYVKLANFVKENSLRFPLEETLIEEMIKLQEDDGAGVGSSGPGSVSAPAGPIATPTNNTTGVAKLDYPLGEKPKRKKDNAIDSPTS